MSLFNAYYTIYIYIILSVRLLALLAPRVIMNSHHVGVDGCGSAGPHGHIQEVGGGGVGVEDPLLSVHDLVVYFCDAGVDDDAAGYIY